MLTHAQQAKNLFDHISRTASGICALGDVLRNTDPEQLEGYTINHLGDLLDIIGGTLLETAHNGVRHCEPSPAP